MRKGFDVTNLELIEQLKSLEQTLDFEEVPDPWEVRALKEAIRQLENRETCGIPDKLWLKMRW